MAKGGGGDDENSLDFLWGIGGTILAGILIWYFGKSYITTFIFYIRLGEIWMAQQAIALWAQLAAPLHLPIPSTVLLEKWQSFIGSTDGPVAFSTINTLSKAVGTYIRYPIILVLIIFGLRLSSRSEIYQTIYNMKQLRQLEQENWPQIKPVVDLDLGNTPLDKGPWAIAISPMNLCKKYKLICEEKNGGKTEIKLFRGAAYRVLSLQLGPQWRGVQALPPHARALFALFIARINNDKDAATKLIIQFATSAASGKLDTTNVDALIRKYQNSKAVVKIVKSHAYVTTVMASLLVAVRETGVLASSEFIWLKPTDRRLWYMLNCVGRNTPFAEISGAFAHWLAEKKLGLPLSIPMVEEAVNGLEMALKDTLYKPEET